jgi:hypothetical protein
MRENLPDPFLHGPSERSLRDDISTAMYMATGLSMLALLVFIVGGLAALFGFLQTDRWWDIPGAMVLVFASYFTAALLGGFAFWALRPLRRVLLGYILTGAVVAIIVYGSVGLLGILGFVCLNINLFEFQSEADAWRLWPRVSLTAGLLTGIPAGLYYWYKQHRRSNRAV